LWLHSLKVAQLLRSAACLHTNQSRSYLNHLVVFSTALLTSSLLGPNTEQILILKIKQKRLREVHKIIW